MNFMLDINEAERWLEEHACIDASDEWQRCSAAFFALIRAWMHRKDGVL